MKYQAVTSKQKSNRLEEIEIQKQDDQVAQQIQMSNKKDNVDGESFDYETSEADATNDTMQKQNDLLQQKKKRLEETMKLLE